METQGNDAVTRAENLVDLREKYRTLVMESTRSQAVGLVDLLLANPITNARRVSTGLQVTRSTALRLLDSLKELAILTEIEAGPRRQRRFIAAEVMRVLEEDIT